MCSAAPPSACFTSPPSGWLHAALLVRWWGCRPRRGRGRGPAGAARAGGGPAAALRATRPARRGAPPRRGTSGASSSTCPSSRPPPAASPTTTSSAAAASAPSTRQVGNLTSAFTRPLCLSHDLFAYLFLARLFIASEDYILLLYLPFPKAQLAGRPICFILCTSVIYYIITD
jgi:hypothetical protein